MAGLIFVTSPVDDTEECCRSCAYRLEGRRLERVVLAGGYGFEAEADTYPRAAVKLVRRLETYLGGSATLVPFNGRALVYEGTWTLTG